MRSFVYSHDYDQNGIIYYLGTSKGTESFSTVAPHFVKVKFSSTHCNPVETKVVSRDTKGYCSTGTNGWIQLEFVKMGVRPSAYSLRAGSGISCFLRNWNFEGSVDGKNWDVLLKHVKDQKLTCDNMSGDWAIATWSLEQNKQEYDKTSENECWGVPDKFYKYLRIRSTGPCSTGYTRVEVGAMEFYGDLMESISWDQERVIWIGHLEQECLLSKLPTEVVQAILSHCKI